MVLDDRIPGVLQSESSSQDKGNGKTKCSISKSCTAFTKTTVDHCQRSKLKNLMSNSHEVPSWSWWREEVKEKTSKAADKGKTRSKGKSTGKGKKAKAKAKARANYKNTFPKGKSNGNWTSSSQERAKARPRTRLVSQMESPTKGKYMQIRTILEVSACEAHTMLRRDCVVGWYAHRKAQARDRKLLELSHLSQAIRDKVNTLRWRVMLGQNESGMLNVASKNNRNTVLCTILQEPEFENIINNVSQDEM